MQMGYLNEYTDNHKAGTHAFRRYRTTFLKNYTDCKDGVYKFWLGHAVNDQTGEYDKIKRDRKFRLESADLCGVGFDLPTDISPIVLNVPKKASMKKAA